MDLEGGCFCGAVRYRVSGEPRVVTHCHCLHCRRTSGAALVTWATFRADDLSWVKGQPARFQTKPEVTRTFCSSCGTPLTYRNVGTPAEVDVVACSLDDPERLSPQDHVFHSRKLSWIHLSDGLPVYPEARRS